MPEPIVTILNLGKIRLELRRLSRARIFIVHGHDKNMKNAVTEYLSTLGLVPIILNEEASRGMTLMEKFEVHSDVSLALILLTPDDMGYRKDHPNEASFRARQNVIFELGFFLGKIGRKRVCALYKEEVELPSDYKGICYVPIDDSGKWRDALVREMKAIGIV